MATWDDVRRLALAPELAELLEEAWLVRAPKRLAAAYLAAHPGVAGPG